MRGQDSFDVEGGFIMRSVSAIVVLIFALAANHALGEAKEEASAGNIRGTVSQSVVFLCDAESGLPIMPDTRKPLDLDRIREETFAFDGFWHAITDENGSFEFKDVPPGKYRLFAQSWVGIIGIPRGLPPDRNDPRPEPSNIVKLHGVAEGVEVKASETTEAHFKRLGIGVQHILCDPEEEHNYVLISLNPTLGDHVLSVAGWDKHFLTGVVGLTRMEVPELTIVGLPEDQEVHVSLFNYDNSGGSGGVSFIPGKQATVRMPIYAGWSNGKYDPPATLEKLTTHLEQSGAKLEGLLRVAPSRTRAYFDYLWQHGHEEIDVPDYGLARIVDIVAADEFRSLRKRHAQRLQRQGHPE
jgi:hypothetical protein